MVASSRQTQLTDWSRNNPTTLGVVQDWHQRAKDKGGSRPALSKEAREAAEAQSIPAMHAIRSTQSELRAMLNGLGDAPTGAAGQQRRQVQAQLAILEKVERMADRRPVDKQVQAAFRRFDANHSGRIDYRELRSALALLGVDSSTENAQKMLQRYDKNASGLLDDSGLLDRSRLAVVVLQPREGRHVRLNWGSINDLGLSPVSFHARFLIPLESPGHMRRSFCAMCVHMALCLM